ncbi:MAG: hemolysin family protein [Myxococcota bacterium]|nr:hemolysin family protein [Myxococcota bacterium]
MLQITIVILLLLLFSAMASGTEAALFAIPQSKVIALEQEGRRGSKALRKVKDNISRPIMAIVIINNIANIIGSIVVGVLAENHFSDTPFLDGRLSAVGVISAILTLLVIIFAEIIPKTVGESRNVQISLFMAPIILLLSRSLFGLIWFIEKITLPVSNWLGVQQNVTSEEEILALTELGLQSGVIEKNESDMIQRVFDLNDVTAWDIMTPLARVDALDGRMSLGKIQEQVMQMTHTRLPVHEGSLDRIIGVVHLRDILEALAEDRMHIDVQSLAKPPSFIPDSVSGSALLKHFKRTKQHLAIVVDAFGTVLGVLTLEDVLEELVGDIVDETDVEQEDIKILSSNEVIASAEADAIDVGDILKIDFPELRIGEFVLEEFGRIPKVGESFHFKNARLTIIDATPRMIQKVRISLMGEEELPRQASVN